MLVFKFILLLCINKLSDNGFKAILYSQFSKTQQNKNKEKITIHFCNIKIVTLQNIYYVCHNTSDYK